MKRRFIATFLLAFILTGIHPLSAQILIGGENPEPENAPKEHTLKYFNLTQVGIEIGIGSFKTDMYNGIQKSIRNDEIVPEFQTINGITYMDKIYLGVSLGVEKYSKGYFWPVYGYIGYDFKQADNTFFASLSLGYGFGHRDATSYYEAGDGAFAMNIGVGYKMKVSKHIRFTYEIFYHYQAIDSKYNIYQTVSDSVTYHSLMDYRVGLHFGGFKIGINFP